MRCKSRRVARAVKAEMSGVGQGETRGRQTRKSDLSSFFLSPNILNLTSDWSSKMVGLCVCGWQCVSVGGRVVVVAGGCLDTDLCT